MGNRPRFRIHTQRIPQGSWSLCVGFSHQEPESYIFLNLFKIQIAIGLLLD